MLNIYDFTIDYASEPQLIRTSRLRFGWKLKSDNINVMQKSYRIEIKYKNSTVCDTGTVESSKLCGITINGLKLMSCSEYTICVTVNDNYSDTAYLEHKVLTEIHPQDWEDALWIKPSHHISGWAPYIRTKFTAYGVKKAIMYASGLGCAEYYINGVKTDDYYIDPPASNYEKTVYYRCIDVTNLIKDGGNALAVLLGEGFYSQSRVWGVNGFVYGDVCVKIKLILEMADGSIKYINTDTEQWKYKYSPITVNNIYGGESYDSRLETPDFSDFDSNDSGWDTVIEDKTPKGTLTAAIMPPVRIMRELPAVSMHGSSGVSDGTWIYDIGENIAGIAEFSIPPSPKGAVYVFRYAETLNAHGELDYRSTGAFATQCIQQDIYITKGIPEGEIYRPRFCYHGFRYVEVSGIHDFSKGYGTVPQLSIVKGIQLSTDMKKTAEFRTSYKPLDDFNKIMDNTFRSNFHGYPEDCPAREKCGWLGDAQIVSDYGMLNYASASSYEKYLHDIRTTKEVYGTWLMIAPGKRGCGEASPLWGCAQIIIPYNLYKYCADTNAVTQNWENMRAWIEHELARSEDYIISEGLGDWDPAGGNHNPGRMPVPHSSSFIFYEICIKMHELVNKLHSEISAVTDLNENENTYYLELAGKIKESVIRHFYNFEKHSYGYIGSDAVALKTGLYPDGEGTKITESLLAALTDRSEMLPTGIYANKYMAAALSELGYADEFLDAFFDDSRRGFGTMLKEGATTVWEEPSMFAVDNNREHGVASYNHPMHGGFMYFCITHIAGICPVKPGFSVFSFMPCKSMLNKNISLSLMSVCGEICVKIEKKNDKEAACTLSVPVGCECILEKTGEHLGSGIHEINIML